MNVWFLTHFSLHGTWYDLMLVPTQENNVYAGETWCHDQKYHSIYTLSQNGWQNVSIFPIKSPLTCLLCNQRLTSRTPLVYWEELGLQTRAGRGGRSPNVRRTLRSRARGEVAGPNGAAVRQPTIFITKAARGLTEATVKAKSDASRNRVRRGKCQREANMQPPGRLGLARTRALTIRTGQTRLMSHLFRLQIPLLAVIPAA